MLRVVQREEASEARNEHHPPEVAQDLAVQATLDRQVPSSAQSDGQYQDSLKRMKTRMKLYQMRNPTVQERRPSNECTTNELGRDSRIPSISDWYSSPHSLQPVPMTLNYTLHITSQNGIAPFPPSHGSVQLKDTSAYQTIEQIADASIQEHCNSSLPHESWRFRNGQCTIREHQPPRRVYALNSVEDWKVICRSLAYWSTSQKDLHRNLDIRREYSSSFTHCTKTKEQASTDNYLKKQDSGTIYLNRNTGTAYDPDMIRTKGWVSYEEDASDPRPGVMPTAAWSSGKNAFASVEVGPPPPYDRVAEILQSEKTPMPGFSGRCHSCNRAQTTEWRRGPDGARRLCNTCGLCKMFLSRLC